MITRILLMLVFIGFAQGLAWGAEPPKPGESMKAIRDEAHSKIVELDKEYRDLALQRRDKSLTPAQTTEIVGKMKANRDARKAEMLRMFGAVPGEPIAAPAKVTVSSPTAPTPDPNKGLFRDAPHAYLVKAPQGWVLDRTAGLNNGLPAVFYPEGSTWGRAPVVLYANAFLKTESNDRTLAAFIAGDKAEAARRDTGLDVKERPGLPTADGTMATVVDYESDTRHEFFAYIDGKNSFVTLVLSSKTPGDAKLVQPVFAQLVRSYHARAD